MAWKTPEKGDWGNSCKLQVGLGKHPEVPSSLASKITLRTDGLCPNALAPSVPKYLHLNAKPLAAPRPAPLSTSTDADFDRATGTCIFLQLMTIQNDIGLP